MTLSWLVCLLLMALTTEDRHEHPHSHDHSDDFSHGHSHDHSPSNNTVPFHPNPLQDLQTTQVRQFYNIPPNMDSAEASYLLRTILSFKYYQRYTFAMNHVRMQQFYALPEAHRNLLQPAFTNKLQAIDEAIEKNAVIARRIARLGEEMYLGGKEVPLGGPITPRQKYAQSTCLTILGIWTRREVL